MATGQNSNNQIFEAIGELNGAVAGLSQRVADTQDDVKTLTESHQSLLITLARKDAQCDTHESRVADLAGRTVKLEERDGLRPSGPKTIVKYGFAGVGGATVIQILQSLWEMFQNKPSG